MIAQKRRRCLSPSGQISDFSNCSDNFSAHVMTIFNSGHHRRGHQVGSGDRTSNKLRNRVTASDTEKDVIFSDLVYLLSSMHGSHCTSHIFYIVGLWSDHVRDLPIISQWGKAETPQILIRSVHNFFIFFYKFSPNPLIGRIDKDRAPAKQSVLRWPCPLPSDRAIPGLWQSLESKV